MKAMLAWPCWWVGGQFSPELFRAFSSMLFRKGLPIEADVKAMLSWPVWQVNGQFSHRLFHSVSSMFNQRGLPKEQEVQELLSWPLWQVSGAFDYALFRSFSSLFSGKGLPKEREVQELLSWPIWQVGGEFNYALFRALSLMLTGKGLPKKEEVNTILSWPIWQVGGQFSFEMFRSFSSLFSQRGLAKGGDAAACMEWLSGADGTGTETLQLMGCLCDGAFADHGTLGLIDRLRDYEQRLLQLFDGSLIDNDQYTFAIKQIVLSLANTGGTNCLSWPECERFLKRCSGPLPTNGTELAPPLAVQALWRLHAVLLAHGGQGVRTFLAGNDQQD